MNYKLITTKNKIVARYHMKERKLYEYGDAKESSMSKSLLYSLPFLLILIFLGLLSAVDNTFSKFFQSFSLYFRLVLALVGFAITISIVCYTIYLLNKETENRKLYQGELYISQEMIRDYKFSRFCLSLPIGVVVLVGLIYLSYAFLSDREFSFSNLIGMNFLLFAFIYVILFNLPWDEYRFYQLLKRSYETGLPFGA